MLWAITFLMGIAFNWVKTAQKDYFDYGLNANKWDNFIIEIFGIFDGFKGKISKVFRDVDKEKLAKRKL